MKTVLIVWNVHLKSAFRSLRKDTRTKVAWFFAISLDFVVGLWSINQLLNQMSQWQVAGSAVLEARLWLLFSGAWLGIGLFAALSTLTLGFGGDQSRLLMTLPVSPAARLRIMFPIPAIGQVSQRGSSTRRFDGPRQLWNEGAFAQSFL